MTTHQRRRARACDTTSVAARRVRTLGASLCIAMLVMRGGQSPLLALLQATGAVRLLGLSRLWLRRNRLLGRCRAAAPLLARALAAELGCGANLNQAIQRAELTRKPGECGLVLERAARRMLLGEPGHAALRQAIADVAGADPRAAGTLMRVADVASVASTSAPTAVGGLTRLAAGMEADAALSAELSSSASEARFVAVALPVVATLMCVVTASVSPRAGATLLTSLGILITCVALGVCCAGVGAVFWMTRT